MLSTIVQSLELAKQQLCKFSTARLDAEVLLAHLLDKPRSYLFAHDQDSLTAQQSEAFNTLVQRRAKGEPIAYMTGHCEFWSLDLQVTTDTLIPRADTELLVELAMENIDTRACCQVADLGTGSGAIALALASECPAWQLSATDTSEKALAVARNNAKRLDINNINFYQGDWCHALPKQKFDIVVSNPPYIVANDPHLKALSYEPQQALVSLQAGLWDIEQIIMQAKDYLKPMAWLMIEHGYHQAISVQKLFEKYHYQCVESHQDIADNDRVTRGLMA